MRTRDKARALEIIQDATAKASDETIAELLCAAIGHPPVIDICFGEVTCARCEARLGDTLAGVYSTKGKFVRGHGLPKGMKECEECETIWKSLTPGQRLLTKKVDS